jgi:enoyl-CoA hydratase/carnithine racemase
VEEDVMDLATLTVSGAVATLTLNRPDARNALSIDLLGALALRVGEVASRPEITVLVLTGAGKAFCAGMDLKAVLNDPDAPGVLLRSLADFTLALRQLPCVTVASVHGAAIGGGCGLACVCDIAVTHSDCKMGYPEVDLGVCPAVVAPWLVKKIGAGRARRVLLSGGLMSGRQAHDIGMVDTVVETGAEVADASKAIAERLATGGPHALRATKSLLNQIDGSMDADMVRRGAELSASIVSSPETRAMLKAKLG